jgi:hypothetical protein
MVDGRSSSVKSGEYEVYAFLYGRDDKKDKIHLSGHESELRWSSASSWRLLPRSSSCSRSVAGLVPQAIASEADVP